LDNESRTILVVDQGGNRNLELASRNLEGVKLVAPPALQPYDLLRHDRLAISKDAALRLSTSLGPKTGEPAPQVVQIQPAKSAAPKATESTPKKAAASKKPAAKKAAAKPKSAKSAKKDKD
jgi:hypothetical protein